MCSETKSGFCCDSSALEPKFRVWLHDETWERSFSTRNKLFLIEKPRSYSQLRAFKFIVTDRNKETPSKFSNYPEFPTAPDSPLLSNMKKTLTEPLNIKYYNGECPYQLIWTNVSSFMPPLIRQSIKALTNLKQSGFIPLPGICSHASYDVVNGPQSKRIMFMTPHNVCTWFSSFRSLSIVPFSAANVIGQSWKF